MLSTFNETSIELCALLQTPRDFKVGDFVTWKHTLLKNTRTPNIGELVIVTEIFEPIRDQQSESGSTYYLQNNDFRYLYRDKDGCWSEWPADSRLFSKVR